MGFLYYLNEYEYISNGFAASPQHLAGESSQSQVGTAHETTQQEAGWSPEADSGSWDGTSPWQWTVLGREGARDHMAGLHVAVWVHARER